MLADKMSAERFYTTVFSRPHLGRTVSEVFAEERTRALARCRRLRRLPGSTTLAYLFFGHPRLTVTRGVTQGQEDSDAAAPACCSRLTARSTCPAPGCVRSGSPAGRHRSAGGPSGATCGGRTVTG